jgi:hypothetical protein
MTLRPLLCALTLTLSAACAGLPLAALAAAGQGADHAHDHVHAAHDHKPLHGGQVVEANDVDVELVAGADLVTLHLRDHGQPLASSGASGKLTLLAGADKHEATLAPAGDNRLQARGSFRTTPGTKVVALIQLPGRKPVNVRFVLK